MSVYRDTSLSVYARERSTSQRVLFHLSIHSAGKTALYLGPRVQVGETEAYT